MAILIRTGAPPNSAEKAFLWSLNSWMASNEGCIIGLHLNHPLRAYLDLLRQVTNLQPQVVSGLLVHLEGDPSHHCFPETCPLGVNPVIAWQQARHLVGSGIVSGDGPAGSGV